MTQVIKEKQDLTYLKWSHVRSSSGTAGTFLKSQSTISGEKIYYKLSNFDSAKGVIGHECVNEVIVDRLLTILGVEHLSYGLINAEIEIEGRNYSTYLCASKDFKEKGESKIALDDFYRMNAKKAESHYDFCVEQGWQEYIDRMIAVDFLILNRDRHGANIEVLRNSLKKTLRIAPLFDHGLSLLYSCITDAEVEKFDTMADLRCQNFIGSYSCLENLSFINDKSKVFSGKLKITDRDKIFEGLDGVVSEKLADKIWQMIYERYCYYENL